MAGDVEIQMGANNSTGLWNVISGLLLDHGLTGGYSKSCWTVGRSSEKNGAEKPLLSQMGNGNFERS